MNSIEVASGIKPNLSQYQTQDVIKEVLETFSDVEYVIPAPVAHEVADVLGYFELLVADSPKDLFVAKTSRRLRGRQLYGAYKALSSIYEGQKIKVDRQSDVNFDGQNVEFVTITFAK